jgi:hypothetical protein
MRRILYIIIILCITSEMQAQQRTLYFTPGDSIQVVLKNSLFRYGTYTGQDSMNMYMIELYVSDTQKISLDAIYSVSLIKSSSPNQLSSSNNLMLSSKNVDSKWVRLNRNGKNWVEAEMVDYHRFYIKLKLDDATFKVTNNRFLNIDSIAEPQNSNLDIRKYKNNHYQNPLLPTSFMPKSGQIYYQNTYLLFNSVAVGIMDNFSIHAGGELITTLIGTPLYFVMPRVGGNVADKLHASVGILHLGIANSSNSYNVATAGITYGSPEKNISFQYGIDVTDNSIHYFSASGFIRTGPYSGFASETIISNSDLISSAFITINTIRFIGKKICFDLGTANFFIPYFSLGYRFY